MQSWKSIQVIFFLQSFILNLNLASRNHSIHEEKKQTSIAWRKTNASFALTTVAPPLVGESEFGDQGFYNKKARFYKTQHWFLSSVEIPRPKRFSSGAKELRKERRKRHDDYLLISILHLKIFFYIFRLGTDTSSGSSKSKKTITSSSTSSMQKHLPKYIQSLFRGRMGTDPCKRHLRKDSNESINSEAVVEFTKKVMCNKKIFLRTKKNWQSRFKIYRQQGVRQWEWSTNRRDNKIAREV
jgi:hypothetical protein